MAQVLEVDPFMRKTLVMIPAFGCGREMYDEVAAALGHDMKIFIHVAEQDRFDAMVDGLLHAVPGHFSVLGTSMGGRLALEVVLAAPDRVEGLVVIGASAGAVADPAAGLRRSARLRGGDMEGVLAEMGAMISHLPGPRGPSTRDAFMAMGRMMGAEAMARQSDALAHRTDRWSRVADITCPTLCLWGAEDKFTPTSEGRRLAAAVQRGRYVELPDCGHFPTLEYPVQTADILKTWSHAALA